MLQKLNELGYEVLPHRPCSPDLSPTDYHFFKHLNNLLQGKRFHNQQDAEMLSKSSSYPKAQIFMLQESTKLFFVSKSVLIVMASILINEFERNYDLKFMVQKAQLFLPQPNTMH